MSSDLIVLEKLTPAVIFAPGGVDAVLEKIKTEVRHTPVDISTKAGRENVASLAYKIARSKTALDKMGKDLGDANYKAWKAITSERARIEKELDDLRDEVRKPLTDWENAEKDRIAAHEAALIAIEDMGRFDFPPAAVDVKYRLDALITLPPREWQEFAKRAADLEQSVIAALNGRFEEATKREAEVAELARLRADEIARQQKERDDRIAAEAAERARIEAEAKAKREAEEVAAKAEAERKRIEQEAADTLAKAKQAAEDAAERAERARIEAEAKAAAAAAAAEERAQAELKAAEEARHAAMLESVRAENERREAHLRAETAEAARVEQAAQAERDAKAAAEAAERRQAAAIEAERQRVADLAAADAAEARRREADTKHRAKINNEIVAALAKLGFDVDAGKLIVGAIARGTIPHTKIEY